MKNYILNNKTVGLLKKGNKTFIYNEKEIVEVNKNINYLLNNNCLFYGSTLDARKKYVKSIINTKYKIPIIINTNIILIQLNSTRDNECLFIVLNKIIDYKYINNKLIINCVNNIKFINKISKYSFEKLLLNGIKIYNILKSKKNDFFL